MRIQNWFHSMYRSRSGASPLCTLQLLGFAIFFVHLCHHHDHGDDRRQPTSWGKETKFDHTVWQGKARQGKARQGKARQRSISEEIKRGKNKFQNMHMILLILSRMNLLVVLEIKEYTAVLAYYTLNTSSSGCLSSGNCVCASSCSLTSCTGKGDHLDPR